MSDIRINALATTATTSASDDYVAIDGSANGTRKLSAYSPTFGGNVTASGNLTVSGTGKIGGGSNDVVKLEADTAGNGGYLQGRNAADTDYTPLILIGNGLTLKRRTGVNSSANALAIDTSGNTTLAGNLTVSGTGTSSVAGSKDASPLKLTVPLSTVGGAALGNYSEFLFENSSSSGGNASIRQYANAWDSAGSAMAFLTCNSSGTLTEWARIARSGNLLVGTTTDGGQKLQVNGTAYVSGDATFAGSVSLANVLTLVNNNSASSAAGTIYNSGNTMTFRSPASGFNFNNSANTANALILSDGGNGTFGGWVATVAPAGGSGQWKLGVANSVSPTSPNRTITVDIGGTTYYLHAKTTND